MASNDLLALKKLASKVSVLYVEDEKEILKNVSIYLEKFFKEVYTASNGEDGLALYNEKKPDIVITDINMPKLDGFEMAEIIKKENEDQNILVVSAYSDVDNFTRFIRLGIDGYILKPIDYQQFNATLYKVVYKISQFKENEHYRESLEQMVEEKTSEIRSLEHEKVHNYKKTLFALVKMIEDRDTYTGGHSIRVAKYARLIAKQLGFDNQSCENIHKAGILHDIGKIAIPDNILLKPGSLDNIEFTLIKEHVNMGVKILEKVPMFQELATYIKAHHERLDGSGYPNGLKGDAIPVEAQILAICDTFDAMTTSRIYKARKTVMEALDEIKSLTDKHFLEKIVDAAIAVLSDIKVDDNISQLPKTPLEQERFAYFYKDQATQSYNATYLDLILLQNSYKPEYKYLSLVCIENLKHYYKEYGWQHGDEYLKSVYDNLLKLFPQDLIFRVFNDDFVILAKEKLDINKVMLKSFIIEDGLHFEIKEFNINEDSIFSLHDLERLR